MNYRPENWDKKKNRFFNELLPQLSLEINAQGKEEFGTKNYGLLTGLFEAGADAHGNELIDDGVFTYGYHTPDIDLNDAQEVSGYWVFIPNDGRVAR